MFKLNTEHTWGSLFFIASIVVLLIQPRSRCCSQCIEPLLSLSVERCRSSNIIPPSLSLARKISRLPNRIPSKSDPRRTLNTVHNLLVSLLSLQLRLSLATLATLLARTLALILATSSLSLLRRRFRLLARSRLAHAAGRSSSVGAGDLGALERVPASAQGAGVLVAELEGDLVDVELKTVICVSSGFGFLRGLLCGNGLEV